MISRHPPQQYYRRPNYSPAGHYNGPGGPPHSRRQQDMHMNRGPPPSDYGHQFRDRREGQTPRSSKPFVLDRYSADPKTPMEIPMYRVINEVPLPFQRDSKGLIPSLLKCFNCGADDHKVSMCQQELSRQFINMNKSWMNEYARIGVKRQKENFNSRYFVQPTKRAKLPAGTPGTDTESTSSVVDRKVKETTPPPTLQVWNNPDDVPKPKEPESPHQQRGPRQHREHREHR